MLRFCERGQDVYWHFGLELLALKEIFFDLLVTNHPKNEFVLKVRRDTWMKLEVYGLLKKYGIGFVISQSDKFYPYAEEVTLKGCNDMMVTTLTMRRD